MSALNEPNPMASEKESINISENVEELNENEAGGSPKLLGTFSRLLVGVLLIGALSTAAVAYAAPSLLEPIANSIPDNLFPQSVPPGKSFGGSGGC